MSRAPQDRATKALRSRKVTEARPNAHAASSPALRCGRSSAKLDTGVAQTVADAARTSACKLLSQAAGEHREQWLPRGGDFSALHGTRCYLHLESSAPALADALNPAGRFGFAIDRINLYVSQGRCGAPLHFDTRTVVIVQLMGTKLWRFSPQPAVADPHRTLLAPQGSAGVLYGGSVVFRPTRLCSRVLGPGDWLMLPQATWHETLTLDRSISATLAAPAPASEI